MQNLHVTSTEGHRKVKLVKLDENKVTQKISKNLKERK